MSEALPPQPEERVVEIRLRHVVLSFIAISGTCLVVGTTLILTRDYVKYLRQQAMVDMAAQLIKAISQEIQWNGEKTDTSSVTKQSKKAPST